LQTEYLLASCFVEFNSFGRYSLLKDKSGEPMTLGHEGWGTVYKAFNDDLCCYAAVRLIARDAFPSKELREQFVSDVGRAVHIRHHSLASVFPLELIDEGYLYATEFCEGETLPECMKRARCLGILSALDIGRQIAGALDVASSAGLLHRNIRAENVMLVQDDEEISVKMLDLALPSTSLAGKNSRLRHDCDFASPEECDGKPIDVRSGVYSLGSLLYYIQAGAEKYALFRAKTLASKKISFAGQLGVPPETALIFKNTLCHDPRERIPTFAKFRDAIEEVLNAPKRLESGVITRSVKIALSASEGGSLVVPSSPQVVEEPQLEETVSPTEGVENRTTSEVGGLKIPHMLLGAAQGGVFLSFKRLGEISERLIVCARDQFRIGRSAAEVDLAMRILPRSEANDTKTRELSRIHVTAKCENDQIFLFDGEGVSPSANGSTFNGQVLSVATPLSLREPGDLRIADVCSIRIIPRILDCNDTPKIANISDWTGPIRESSASTAGAIIFVPECRNEIGTAVWLFSAALFGSSRASPLNFAFSAGEQEIGALHYYRRCFWIELRYSGSLSVDDFVLAPAEIAPLVTGQTLEVNGCKYSIEIDEMSASVTSTDTDRAS
jgi:serine/threonine protein kinase